MNMFVFVNESVNVFVDRIMHRFIDKAGIVYHAG